MSLLMVSNVSKSYRLEHSWFKKSKQIKALQNVSLTLEHGTSIGIVGRSGSGKSTLAKIIMGIEKADQGHILFKGIPFTNLDKKSFIKMRRHVQMVFQDPWSSLNPRMTIGRSIAEPLENYFQLSAIEKREEVNRLLEAVGLMATDADKYPSQFSGGQLQRINIARAISLKPDLLVLDEVVSSLDTVSQVQVLELLLKLQKQYNLSYLFISHDLQAVTYISDHFIVMDEGRIVEEVFGLQHTENLERSLSKNLVSSVPLAH
ncbi:ABC transporter ATP-binding protein [Robertmurraya massiliosenegalensis]|uniref:ABC transporter ATP-binding protein n=1 Tax=Robertmurraya massiliosenegalensis TaxID=1287657 RepID=UPI00030A9DEB|nr:dipeptide/oligopeptide/nickel ABC transporter ATP-binding protein [Robertmurraya massiliosenegalensis]